MWEYDYDKILNEINNSEVVKELLDSNVTFVGEYPKKVPIKSGGYIPPCGKEPLAAYNPNFIIETELESRVVDSKIISADNVKPSYPRSLNIKDSEMLRTHSQRVNHALSHLRGEVEFKLK